MSVKTEISKPTAAFVDGWVMDRIRLKDIEFPDAVCPECEGEGDDCDFCLGEDVEGIDQVDADGDDFEWPLFVWRQALRKEFWRRYRLDMRKFKGVDNHHAAPEIEGFKLEG